MKSWGLVETEFKKLLTLNLTTQELNLKKGRVGGKLSCQPVGNSSPSIFFLFS